MIHLFDLQNINDADGDIDYCWDIRLVFVVKAEGRDLLVVVVLGFIKGLEKISNQQERSLSLRGVYNCPRPIHRDN